MSSTKPSKSFQPLKTVWRGKYPYLWSFFCPLCKIQRSLPFRSQPGSFEHLVQIGLTTLLFTLICWNWLDWKGLAAFFPFWCIFEIVYRWRKRVALRCSYCGFDPYLFLIDEEWAKKEIETHWKMKFQEKGIPYPQKQL